MTSPAKKHYQGMVKVQEGTVFANPKIDIKGKYMPLYMVTYKDNLLNCWNILILGQSAAKTFFIGNVQRLSLWRLKYLNRSTAQVSG